MPVRYKFTLFIMQAKTFNYSGVKMIKDFISYLIFGNHCKYCDELIAFGEMLCNECKSDLPRITGEKCRLCGAGKDRCTCKKAKMKYDGICAPFYYEKTVETAIRKFKFADKPYIAKVLAKDTAETVKADFADIKFDFIDYIPFSKSQNKKRKYNPAGEIAREMSKILGIPIQNALTKPFETETQHISGAFYRKGNVAGAYDILDGADLQGKTVLLVDDIKTTGATLNECARVLKIAGAERVYCAVAALTAKEKQRENEEKTKL